MHLPSAHAVLCFAAREHTHRTSMLVANQSYCSGHRPGESQSQRKFSFHEQKKGIFSPKIALNTSLKIGRILKFDDFWRRTAYLLILCQETLIQLAVK